MPTVVLALGSNIGDREANLRAGISALSRRVELKNLRVSRFADTLPVGGPPQANYLNGAIRFDTEVEPRQLLQIAKAVEVECGRTPSIRFGPRVLDVDILSYGSLTLDLELLTIPHPRLLERLFALEPLAEIYPDWVHPVKRQSATELLNELLHGAHP